MSGFKKITTKDNSITFFSEKYKENYHSVSGAEEEAIKKFVKPTLGRFKGKVRILDICFGLGYNSAAALEHYKEAEIMGIENDQKILNEILNINSNFKNYHKIKETIKNNYKSKNIRIIIGDAKKIVKKLKGNFDIVFFDPFSPKKQPELWKEEFFKDIRKLMKKGSVLTTYSCAKKVREALKKANFKTFDVEAVGRRAPSTLAIAY